jgi:A/G-specific adenine glycosylase
MPKINKTLFRKQLSAWYEKNRRDLPWRRMKDPYKIWISEIMLQQTQVDTVKDYYQKWIQIFPTVEALSLAHLDEVLNLWAGLGYYRRARMIHAAAKIIVAQHHGNLPDDTKTLRSIPGIGKYTAGAISSIAFEKKEAVVDGNVMRILTRIYAINDDISQGSTQKRLWEIATDLLPNQSIGDFNQALMELGATICFPKNPQCFICPVAKQCIAHQQKNEITYPVKNNRIKMEKVKNFALILRKKNLFLIQKQSEKARWGGLWMFPYWDSKKSMFDQLKALEKKPKLRMQIKHGYTKYLIQLDVYQGETDKSLDVLRESEIKWVSLKQMTQLALPSHHKKIAHLLEEQEI